MGRVLLKLYELDQYDDAELVRKKTAAMFAGFITKNDPDTPFMGEGTPDDKGAAQAGLEPGTLQLLEPGEDVKFSEPGDVGGILVPCLAPWLVVDDQRNASIQNTINGITLLKSLFISVLLLFLPLTS